MALAGLAGIATMAVIATMAGLVSYVQPSKADTPVAMVTASPAATESAAPQLVTEGETSKERQKESPEPTAAIVGPSEDISRDLQAAVNAQAWPSLRMSEGWNDWQNLDGAQCQDFPQGGTDCVFPNPNASKTAVFTGDSMAQVFLPGLRGRLEAQGYEVRLMNRAGCPTAEVPYEADYVSSDECRTFREQVAKQIADLEPDLTVVVAQTPGMPPLSMEQYAQGVVPVLDAYANHSKSLVFLRSPPVTTSLTECKTKFSKPSACLRVVTRDESPFRVAIDNLPHGNDNVTFIDTTPWFCVADTCPAFSGDIPISSDGEHPTPAYAQKISESLYGAIQQG